jgi:hypothetical protein
MKLYEIDQQIENCIDPETGEIADFELFEQLQMERDTKLENVACWIKNLKVESDALKQEETNLKSRRQTTDNQIERLTNYLEYALNGEKFKTSKVAISYRNSKSVNIIDEEKFIEWAQGNNADLLKIKTEPSKTAIKEAITNGQEVQFADIVENKSITIK